MTKIGLKGASGLGDSIYGYPIVKYYANKYDIVYYMTDYPLLFADLKNVVCTKHQKINYIAFPDRRQPIDIRFTYCGRKYTPGTSQFTDSCISARIKEDIKLEIPWETRSTDLVNKIKRVAKGRKICIVSAPYEPFGREDEWGAILRIKPDIMQTIINKYKEKILFVQIGNKFVLNKLSTEIEVINQTSYTDLFDIVSVCDFGMSQIGNMLPLCECLGKKNFIIFNKAAMESENKFIAAITPDKTVHYKKLNCSVLDDNIERAVKRFDGFINF